MIKTKTAFLLQLRKGLKPLPKEERENALIYYREYFEDNAGRNEAEICSELGDPKNIAREIVNEYAGNNPGYPVKKGMSTGSVVLIVVLSILAAPILLPIAAAALALALAIAVTVIAAVVSFFAVAAALLVGGIGLLVAAFFVGAIHWPTTLLMIGGGLMTVGVGILIWLGVLAICRALFGSGKKAKERHAAQKQAQTGTPQPKTPQAEAALLAGNTQQSTLQNTPNVITLEKTQPIPHAQEEK